MATDQLLQNQEVYLRVSARFGTQKKVGIRGTRHEAKDLIHKERLARPERFELPTSWFVAMRSIQLSYGRSTKVADGASRPSLSRRSTAGAMSREWAPRVPSGQPER